LPIIFDFLNYLNVPNLYLSPYPQAGSSKVARESIKLSEISYRFLLKVIELLDELPVQFPI
jgi:hypothetical protein